MFCPVCNGRVVYLGRIQVIYPLLRHTRQAEVLICTNCTAVTEVDVATGRLLDYRPLTVGHLYAPFAGRQRRLTEVSLQGGSPLYLGRES